tara:strand:- start:325 stop:2886 length:2562 start_codon:yes stop_codon:yes gene_type:complete
MAIQNNAPFVRHVGGTEGDTGWDQADVLNAIEQVLADAGIHGSSTRKSGVIVNCQAPGYTGSYNGGGYTTDKWLHTGGKGIKMPGAAYRQIRVTANGNSNYILTPTLYPGYFHQNGEIRFTRMGGGTHTFATNISNGVDIDQVSGLLHDGYQTGDSFILRNPSGDPANIPPELTVGNTYYMIVPDDYTDVTNDTWVDTIRLAPTQADAIAKTNIITFASNHNFGSPQNNENIDAYTVEFELPAVTKVSVRQGDRITFHLNNLTGHPTAIVDTTNTTLTFPGGTYSDVRELNYTNFQALSSRGIPQNQGIETGRLYWDIDQWVQGDYALQCKNHTGMQNVIEIKPSINNYMVYNSYHAPYWDYEVPASGGREACTFRVFRRGTEMGGDNYGGLEGIRIQSQSSGGWTANEVFTIPGDQVGGASPENDIVFGVNSSTTQQQADRNAVPSVQILDVGSASNNFYAKYIQGKSAILEIDNDVNKTYGKTYYGIRLASDNQYQLQIGAGVGWNYLNWNPTSTTAGAEGCFSGVKGFDYVNSSKFTWDTTHYTHYEYATGTNANTYPLKVQVWKANTNDPQDPNFHVLQFVQNINGNDISQLSLYFHKGTVIGNGIWDLDHVWQGGFTSFSPHWYASAEETIKFETNMAKGASGTYEDLNTSFALRRCAEYGYYRDAADTSSDNMSMRTYYSSNLYNNNNQTGGTIKPYFRDNSYDKSTIQDFAGDNPLVNIEYGGGLAGKATGGTIDYGDNVGYYLGNKNDIPATTQMPAAANYYKPIKGLPIQNCLAPVPYYLPDDYVVIPFNVTPGATTFHTGDAIEVSASEIYKIIEVSYTVNQTTYDGVASNSCKGIAFCARTT